jgi:hypothetical protein
VLRQLARLTRPVPAAGPNALAVAVYSDETGETLGARETGEEGVACVDDAARAFVLLCNLWTVTGNPRLRTWAEGLLDFLLWMHDGAGRWVNFIYDWDGARNLAGPTSSPGANFWQARATTAMTAAVLQLESGAARPVLRQALASAAESSPPADVRALHALAAIDLLSLEPDPWLSTRLSAWCEELAACSADGMLMNSPDERGRPHLWGHVQEVALADGAGLLGRPALCGIARRSADAVFEAIIESGFDLPLVQPYDVQSAVFVMDRLGAATGDGHYLALAAKARAWFGRRNPAREAVYLPDRGRVSDGIDAGVLNGHSGAEANISAGLALSADPAVRALAKDWAGPPPEPGADRK